MPAVRCEVPDRISEQPVEFHAGQHVGSKANIEAILAAVRRQAYREALLWQAVRCYEQQLDFEEE